MRIFFLFLSLICVMGNACLAQEIANYGIEGWANHTIGGRGGRIIRVTTLNATGAGSFTEAIYASGPRIIVFEVGGVIKLLGSSKTIKNPFVTIAGQTAPDKGITIINGGLNIQTHDVILQHIRIRTGAAGHVVGSWEPDAMTTSGAYNVIIDHCSFSWSVDENCSASGDRFDGATPDEWRKNTSHIVTISNNIIAEGLSNATHSKGEHSKGSLIHDNATDIAILNNLYASNRDRNPLFKGGVRGVIVNNYINNPGVAAIKYGLVDSEWSGHAPETGFMSIVGNYMQYGQNTGSISLCNIGNGPCEVFLSGNVSKNRSGGNVEEYKGDANKRVYVKPVWNDNIHVIHAVNVEKNILENAGARPWDRDETDKRLINEMVTKTGKIINYETEVGGYPNYDSSSKPFIEEEWNLDYMMKISPDISILAPLSGNQFTKDSIITVESEISTNSDSINYLELLVNGESYGKLTKAPYKWDITINKAGNYELLVLADSDSTMKTVSKAIQIIINEPIASDLEISIKPSPSTISSSIFPNPFRETATINYDLTQPEFVILRIFNIMGQQIQTLMPGFQPEGQHKAELTAECLPSGIYYYYLIVGDDILCNKFIHE